MSTIGWNLGYVDELYARYLEDPESVSEAWRDFFADYRSKPSAEKPAPPREQEPRSDAVPTGGGDAEPLRGAAARVVDNMNASLEVPTATSTRNIPVKLLEENRRLVNQHQATISGTKVSFTHLIAWAIVRALQRHPAMNSGFEMRDGVPHRVSRGSIALGLAIDVERRERRMLVVPNIDDAGSLDFPGFVLAYNDRVDRARSNKLEVDELLGTTVTLTNPGMIGTAMSVPRLMVGQGTIVGIGKIGYPAEYTGMAPEVISELGLSKVMTVTSTYDHRIIQGAESGAFLETLEALLTGAHGFYQEIFRSLNLPHEPVGWSGDQNPQMFSGVGSTEAIEKQAQVIQLIRAYRVRGHLLADLNPLGHEPGSYPELEISNYGLTLWDLDRRFIAGGLAGSSGTLTLREILDILRETYCRHVGVEFMHVQEQDVRCWLQTRMERTRNHDPLPVATQLRILSKLNAAEAFERFLHTTYVGHKRFSLEGAETLIPMLDALLNLAAEREVEDVVIGMAHRGRLNVLANVIGKSHEQIFREFEGDLDPSTPYGSGDVKYHLGAIGEHVSPDDDRVRLAMASNPSHLEAVNPVVEGMARARQDRSGDVNRERILPVLIHGDAAFPGQGVVAETLSLSQLKGYRTGGTVHIVVNNQIGFTTGPAEARSSRYATDVAKMVQAPIFHVNGDHPEDAVRVVRLALAFRQEFKRDVVVDLLCYRRWGHNEADDPSFTHPTMYFKIDRLRSVRKRYTEELLRRGDIDGPTAENALEDFRKQLEAAFRQAREAQIAFKEPPPPEEMEPVDRPGEDSPATGVDRALLERILDGLAALPDGFEPHPKLAKQLARRRERFESGEIDWALAEALSLGSLVLDGTPVRLSGEDSGRGTFSQRHAALYDHRTGEAWVPLARLDPAQAPFVVVDSPLSEFAVLGFEYGFSVDHSDALVLWEAQFGDFSNGAQVIIDQFVASAEDKWGQTCGLVMLLPHGYEGQGPDHSSARPERFLQLAAHGNMRVAWPSTPAQYFHLLRRQARSAERKPLVVMTPKSLLRLRDASSPVEALCRGDFRTVLDDPRVSSPDSVERLVLATGKVYYDLLARQRQQDSGDVAIVRLEQLYPFPAMRLAEILERYSGASEVVWLQEEPANMGAWGFVEERLRPLLPPGRSLRYVGRPRSASPASGSYKRYVAEQEWLIGRAFEARPTGARSGRNAR
jgi:2-oxoglutarate dehydrogenase E1 component